MTPIQLFPSDATHKKSMIIGGVILLFTLPQASLGADTDGNLFAAIAAFGAYMVGQAVWAKLHPKPAFEADADGFSVVGKPKRGWDEYRGAAVHTARVWFVPVARSVVIKTGKTVLGGRVHIYGTKLSAPAKEMATEIERYAQEAKLLASLGPVAAAAKPEAPEPRGVRPVVASGGPVESVPSFGERLFGSRKVI